MSGGQSYTVNRKCFLDDPKNIDKENDEPLKEIQVFKQGQDRPLTLVREKDSYEKPSHRAKPELTLTASSPPSISTYVSSLPENLSNSNLFQFPPPNMFLHYSQPLSPLFYPPVQQMNSFDLSVQAVVDEGGWISLHLRHGVRLDISDEKAVRVHNTIQNSSLSLSSCTTQMALVHPHGRVLQYGPRIEVQVVDMTSVKNAKIYPKGISFTANNCALVYLLDEAGARTLSDMFHDLFANQISDTLFLESCGRSGPSGVGICIDQLEIAQYWRSESGIDCWIINDVRIQQTNDGFVTVERDVDGDIFRMKSSPNNGKVRYDSRHLQVTASLGDESHLFLRSRERRLHYNGQSTVFTVRNAGHSAGFDDGGMLRIF